MRVGIAAVADDLPTSTAAGTELRATHYAYVSTRTGNPHAARTYALGKRNQHERLYLRLVVMASWTAVLRGNVTSRESTSSQKAGQSR